MTRSSELAVTAVEAANGLGANHVSWIVSRAGRRVIHCGDTLWHGSWWKLGIEYGPFDAAFLPINGTLVRWPVPPSGITASLTPEQAAAAAQIPGVRLACANHDGRNSPPDYVEFPSCENAFLEAARGRASMLWSSGLAT